MIKYIKLFDTIGLSESYRKEPEYIELFNINTSLINIFYKYHFK